MNRDVNEKKVLMVIKKFHQDYAGGGAERSGFRLAKKLADKGVTVDIIGAKMRTEWRRREWVGEGRERIRVDRLFHPGLRFLGTLIYNVLLLFRILSGRNRYSCVHIHFASFEMMTAVIARWLGGPPVLCKIACSGESGEIAKAKKRYFSPLFFFLLRRIDAAAALSEEIRTELAGAGLKEEKISVIPNGIDPSLYRPVGPEEKQQKRRELGVEGYDQVMIFTGRLTRQKGLDVLFESLEKMGGMNYLLIIAGRGELEPELKKKAAELGINHRIRFSGPVSDVLSLYQAGDIFVLPSRQEGLSNSLLEAMSSGMKVVATAVSGSSRLIENGISGLLVPPEDPEKLCSALREAFSADDSIGRKARERIISGYSIELVADSYISIYRKIGRCGRPASD